MLKNNVRFSIHVPVYNAERFLTRCIDSLLAQTFKSFEIILTDDGSTDNSGRICDAYAEKDACIRVFHNENHGVLWTRCFSIYKSNGDYSMFVDSDDFIECETLNRINQIIEQHSSDLVIFNYRRVIGDEKKDSPPIWDQISIFENNNKKELYDQFLFTSSLNNICMKAVRTELLLSDPTNYQKYSHVTNAEDFLQSLYIIFHAQKIVYLPDCLYNYCYNNMSTTNKVNLYRFKSILSAREKGAEYLSDNLFSEDDRRKYATFIMQSMVGCVLEIATSEVNFSKKIEVYNEINSNHFFSKFVRVKCDYSLLKTEKRWACNMFVNEQYKRLQICTFAYRVYKTIKEN